MWREVRVQENKEEERQTEREGFNKRFMNVFILKRTEGTCSFKANKSRGNVTKTYFPMSTLQLKTIFSCFSLIIFHIHRVLYYEFFYYALKSNWCVISYTISFLIKVMDRRVFTIKSCQNKPFIGFTRIWYTLPNPAFAKKYYRRSFALTPRPHPLTDFPAHPSLRRTIWTPGTGKCLARGGGVL